MTQDYKLNNLQAIEEYFFEQDHSELDSCKCCQGVLEILMASPLRETIRKSVSSDLFETERSVATERCIGAVLALRTDDYNGTEVNIQSGFPFIIGKYEFGTEIGKGSFGIVFAAKDTVLKRECAIKVVSNRSNLDEARSLVEAKDLARANCPNVVQVFDVFDDEDYSYIVMEKLGKSLEESIDETRRTLEIIDVMDQISKGASALHRKGIVHCDIKPSNILWDSGKQAYKIADLGIAQRVDQTPDSTARIIHKGTPAFRSPEQSKDSHAAVPSDDVFSLGRVLKALLVRNSNPDRGAVPNPSFWSPTESCLQRVMNRCLQETVQRSEIGVSRIRKGKANGRYLDGLALQFQLTRIQNHFPPTGEGLVWTAIQWVRLRSWYSRPLQMVILVIAILLASAGVFARQNYLSEYEHVRNIGNSADEKFEKALEIQTKSPKVAMEMLQSAIDKWESIRNWNMETKLGLAYLQLGAIQLSDRLSFADAESTFQRASALLEKRSNEESNNAIFQARLLRAIAVSNVPERKEEALTMLKLLKESDTSDIGLVYALVGEKELPTDDLDKLDLPTVRGFVIWQERALEEMMQSGTKIKPDTILAVRFNLAMGYERLEMFGKAALQLIEIEGMFKAQPDKLIEIRIRKANSLARTSSYEQANNIVEELAHQLESLDAWERFNLTCISTVVWHRYDSELLRDSAVSDNRRMRSIRLLKNIPVVAIESDPTLKSDLLELDDDLVPLRSTPEYIEWVHSALK